MKGAVISEADLLTNLPNNIIENILGCLPLRDVVRTSILSREWRYKWLSCPEIVFDFWFDQMFLGDHKLEPLIYQILKLQKGPLLKFALQVPDLKSSPDIDQWNLRNLKLYNCVFDPVPGFKGFSKLVNLELQSVALVPETFGNFIASCPAIERLRLIHCTNFDFLEITGPRLKCFEFHGVFKSVSFKNCPVLSDVKLTFSSMDFKRGNRFSLDLVKSLSCLPALEDLQLQAYALEVRKLFVVEQFLDLLSGYGPGVNVYPFAYTGPCRAWRTQQTARLSEYAEKPSPFGHAFTFDVVDSVADFLRYQTSSESLSQLKTVKMQLFSGIEAEMEFVKYLLASATALEEMTITPHGGSITDGGESILNEIKQYPRASPSAAILSSEKSNGKKHI
ncbi:UNVERIFIED_CONTAM: F-box/LRR-repeat protein [Sesamum calycinum]|uniref:F-box/LRR-repeat protein n=1 Tax=Sesamum calycinum TaxID=2727403 RepID=A0AAW2KU41_9LAMI